MKPIPTRKLISKAKFLRWLKAQPYGRTFDFTDTQRCLFASFLKEYARQWREKNRERLNAARRAARLANPEPMRAACRRSAARRITVERVERRARYHSDRQFKLMLNLRSRVRSALKASSALKTAHTKELIGCPVVWLEAWLESLFKPGMTWENHGPVWHIDHIKPCAAFDLRDPEQQKICFHWSNHQPLFALDNIQKSDKYES